MKLNIGPGPHYQEGWTNVEVEQTRGIFEADLYTDDPMKIPVEDESADIVYAAHILEHIEWELVPTYLQEVHRVLKTGGNLIVIGPDMIRGMNLWKAGKLQFHFDDHDPGLLGMLEWESLPNWNAPRHYWNCHESRLITVLEPFFQCRAVDIASPELDPYPIVSRAAWQCSIICTKED